MRTAVIVDAVRTPIGRAHDDKGWFRQTRSDDLAVACVRRLLERTRIPPDIVDDVLFGATQQTGQQGTNVARLIGLMSGLPHRVAGVTINRLCGSSLQALHQAVHAIQSGAEDVQIVGGLEHMGRLPWGDGSELNPRLFHSIARGSLHMGLTAELLAR
ncbi:MAG TPA: beta-ketoacyl synthase N-terminal-like domain-containing protein, partial [Pirellulaceae bacterium]|nr:beta-ketoacyl synthase N-terminal-like domain-containing protein [Pirellulaceae bacterium]